MADMLDKHEKHLFLEKENNTENSFIANVNILAKKIDELVELNHKLTVEQIAFLSALAESDAPALVADLEKGSASGYRKLDIDLLKNYLNYQDSMTDDEKRLLWASPSAKVYYDRITVTFKDKTSISKTFQKLGLDTVISNHHELYDQLANWNEFKAKYDYTIVNISEDTVLFNHELLRITDGQGTGSTIEKVVLHVAPQGQNLNYDAAYQGAKEHDPSYTWLDTTSVLLAVTNELRPLVVLGNKVQDMSVLHEYLPELTRIHASLNELVNNSDSIYLNMGNLTEIVNNLADILKAATILDRVAELEQEIEAAKIDINASIDLAKANVKSLTDEAKISATTASNAATVATEKANSILNLSTHVTTLSSELNATANYRPDTGMLELGIPKGVKGDIPAHEWVGTAIRFQNPDGSWGDFVDLQVDSYPIQERLTQLESRVQELENR